MSRCICGHAEKYHHDGTGVWAKGCNQPIALELRCPCTEPRPASEGKCDCGTDNRQHFADCSSIGSPTAPPEAKALEDAAWKHLEAMSDKWDDEILEAMPAKRSSHRLITRAMVGFAAKLLAERDKKTLAKVRKAIADTRNHCWYADINQRIDAIEKELNEHQD